MSNPPITVASNADIHTPRLQLRRFTLDDVEIFYELGSHPEVIRYAQRTPLRSLEEARERLLAAPLRDYEKHGYGRLVVVEKASSLPVGWCGLKYVDELGEVDIGYRLLPEYWGKGYALEACRAVLEHGWGQSGLRRIVATVIPENVRSLRVLSALGFVYERRVRLSGDAREYELHALADYHRAHGGTKQGWI